MLLCLNGQNTIYSIICIYANIEISIRKLVIGKFYKTFLIYVFLVKCYNNNEFHHNQNQTIRFCM